MAANDPKARSVAILAAGAGMFGLLSSMAVLFPHIDPAYEVAMQAAEPDSPFSPGEATPTPPHPLSIALLPVAAEPGQPPVPAPLMAEVARDVENGLDGLGMHVADNRAAAAVRRNTPFHEAGRQLGVRYVLSATVGGTEDDLRINATLTDCATKRVLWKGTFWKTMRSGGFEGTEIAAALRTVLPLELQRNHVEEF
jgi:TolB-like protein